MAPQNIIKRQVTVGELLGFAILVFGAILSFYVSTNTRLSALEINQRFQQENASDTKAAFKEIGGKLNELSKGQNEIKITLQNKQDRK